LEAVRHRPDPRSLDFCQPTLTDIDGEDELWLDEDFPAGDGVADVDTIVTCPYCGEEVEIGVDPGGGSNQSYVEDCPVCCSPWMVRVHYSAGAAEVTLSQTEA
jgi:hypothetical protein